MCRSVFLIGCVLGLSGHMLCGQKATPFAGVQSSMDSYESALGGHNVSLLLRTSSLLFQNPALMGAVEENSLSMSFLDVLGDVQAGQLSFVRSIGQGKGGVGVRFLSYGNIAGYDETGQPTHTFGASTYMFNTSYAHTLGAFTLGANLRPVLSAVDVYRAYTVFLDMGMVFRHPRADFSVGMVVKNLSFFLKNYTGAYSSYTPLDLWIGTSYRAEGLPMRFSLTSYGLTESSLLYKDSEGPLEVHQKSSVLFAKIFSRLNFAVEVLVGEYVRLIGAYDYKLRQNFVLDERAGAAGFSFGFALGVGAFGLGISRSHVYVRGGNTHLTLTIHFNKLWKKHLPSISEE